MSETTEFSGLKMPVFTAFGWAGEETAIQFALSQLEFFIQELHGKAPKAIKDMLPFFGLNKANQNVYIAAKDDLTKGLHLIFNARTSSLELQISLAEKKALDLAYKQILKQPTLGHRLVTELGKEWSIHVQQKQYDSESEEASTYQDLFKDNISKFDNETAVAVFEKAAYLNGEEKWVTPLFINRRFDAEKVATMGVQLIDVMVEELTNLVPLLTFLVNKTTKKASKKAKPKTTKAGRKAKSKASSKEMDSPVSIEEGFSYASELKPLHIRKGFVNLTPQHWPFFSINSRTETRPVTVYYEGVYDKGCAVWRMLPDDRARLVLSPPVHEWLEQNFSPDHSMQVIATKISPGEIQISLKSIND